MKRSIWYVFLHFVSSMGVEREVLFNLERQMKYLLPVVLRVKKAKNYIFDIKRTRSYLLRFEDGV